MSQFLHSHQLTYSYPSNQGKDTNQEGSQTQLCPGNEGPQYVSAEGVEKMKQMDKQDVKEEWKSVSDTVSFKM